MTGESEMTTIESELEYLRKKLTMYSKLYEKREWKTQDGDVLWWRFPFKKFDNGSNKIAIFKIRR